MRRHLFAAALFVTFLPLHAWALGLGTPQRSAWIGQPQDLRVPLALESGHAGSLWAQLDLRQGAAAHASIGGSAVVEPGPAPWPATTPAVSSRAAAPRASVPAATATAGRLKLDALEPLPPATGPAGAAGPAIAVASMSPSAPLSVALPVPDARARAGTASGPRPATGAARVPSGTLAEVQRTAQLEAALAELRAQARQNQQTLTELRAELAEARGSRYSNPLIHGLLLLLLMAAAALWTLWRIARRAPELPGAQATQQPGGIRRFLRRRESARIDADDDETSHAPLYFPAAVSRRGQVVDAADDEIPDALDGGRGGVWDRAERMPAAQAPGRALDVDELFDVQQQAEFFTSLGQHEQAIDALSHYVNQHPKASALAYLELLHLYHQLRREPEYEQLRRQCQDALNVHVPGFHEFGAVGGRTLEHYPEARARLQSHWPHPGTLEVIEDLLFRRGDAAPTEAFDLAAYRELLMLYALVQDQQFAQGQAWPSLEDLLRLPRLDGAATLAASPASPASPSASGSRTNVLAPPLGGSSSLAQGAGEGPFERFFDTQRRDFQPTWPPSLDQELDIDLARLEAQQIDTIPLALRRVPHASGSTLPETVPLAMRDAGPTN